MSTRTNTDLVVGAALGALGAVQGVALPGMLVLGVGYDAAASGVASARPDWFPNGRPISGGELLATAAGVTVGWLLMRTFFPRMNPTGYEPILAAGVIMMAGRGGVQTPRPLAPRLR